MECKRVEDKVEYEDIQGLTDEEVQKRVLNGDVNKLPKAPSKTFLQILRSNFFTMFNALNLVLAVAVIIAGSPKNAIFAGVIIVNSLIGVIQEVKAKNIIEKLSVISEANCMAIRNGKIKKIGIEDIVKDDIIYIKTGDQILADGIVYKGNELEVDESMLTGESDPIHKRCNSKLLSGSFVVAGDGYMKVTKVGSNTYSSKLADEARKFKITNSELQNSLNKILKVLLILIIPIGILLATTQLIFIKSSWQDAVIGTVSGIIGMVPEGLVLLTSATFIVAIIKLSQYDTLVQELSATEVLARVDVLCVDKTGTITEGALKLIDVKNVSNYDNKYIDDISIEKIKNNYITIHDSVAWRDKMFLTKSGKFEINLYKEDFIEDNNNKFRLLTNHSRDTLFSQHMMDKEGISKAYINESMASNLKIKSYEEVTLKSKNGSINVEIIIDNSIADYIVMMYVGWWTKHGNPNYITVSDISDIGGQIAYNETFVSIEK